MHVALLFGGAAVGFGGVGLMKRPDQDINEPAGRAFAPFISGRAHDKGMGVGDGTVVAGAFGLRRTVSGDFTGVAIDLFQTWRAPILAHLVLPDRLSQRLGAKVLQPPVPVADFGPFKMTHLPAALNLLFKPIPKDFF